VLRVHVQLQLLHDPGQARGLPAGQIEDQAGEGRRIDDGVLQGRLEAASDQVGVERVVAVLDQNRTLGEPQKSTADLGEAGCVLQHVAVDLVPLPGVGVDGRPSVDQGVEGAQAALQVEPLGPDLDHQERRVAGGLDVERHELGELERRVDGHRAGRTLQLGVQDALLRAAGPEIEL